MYYIIYYIYTTYKQFKVQIIGVLEEIHPFYIDQKCTYEKEPKNWARPSLPLIWTRSKRRAVSPRETVPNDSMIPSHVEFIHRCANKHQIFFLSFLPSFLQKFWRVMVVFWNQKSLELTNLFGHIFALCPSCW